jgi:hypothetical protein
MHTLIKGIKKGFYIDHVNRNRLDNRKSNLRFATKSQNGMNKTVQRNNKSGVVGVSWHEKCKSWTVRIVINGKATYLGLYKNFDEAVAVRKRFEEIYYGEFAPKR